MATQVQNAGWGYRLGRATRRALRSYRRGEHQAAGWLVTSGLPGELAWAAVWAFRLSVGAVLLYAAFWVALVLLFGVAAAWVAQNADPEEYDPPPEWREGHSGFGLYDNSDWRLDK